MMNKVGQKVLLSGAKMINFMKDMWKNHLWGKHKLRDELRQKDKTQYPAGAAGVTDEIHFVLSMFIFGAIGCLVLFVLLRLLGLFD